MYLGFEYEVNVELKSEKAEYKTLIAISENWVPELVEPGLYDEPGSGVKAIVDGTHVEFVTQPINQRKDLEDQVATLYSWGDRLKSQINAFDKVTNKSKDRKVKQILQDAEAEDAKHEIHADHGYDRISVLTASHKTIPKGEFAEVQHTISLPLKEVYKIFGQWSNIRLSCKTNILDARLFDVTDAAHTKVNIDYMPKRGSQYVTKALYMVNPKSLVEEQQNEMEIACRDGLNINNCYRQSLGNIRNSTAESEALTNSGFADYEGIAFLVAEYLNRFAWAQSGRCEIDYQKAMFPILARTSFDSMVNSLNPLTLVWFDREKPLNQLVDNWAKAFVKLNKNTISDMHKSNSTKVWAQHINPDSGQLKNDKKWEDIRKDMKTLYSMAKPKFKVTVDDWLLGLHTTADRKDMFSQKHNKEIDSS
ncbi:MAG: hypothetical protein MJK04_26910, partial [Psychrosphaera sp.]|nr:hypothetical protein [Psychrosphaera sp.]